MEVLSQGDSGSGLHHGGFTERATVSLQSDKEPTSR